MVLQLIPLTTEQEIAAFLQNGGNLIFMYGPKCGPCQRLKPKLLEELALVPRLVRMGFLDAQAHRELRAPYGASLIPFLIVFDDRSDSSSESDTDLVANEGEPARKIRGTLQNSDMDAVRPFLNKYLDLGLKDPNTAFDDTVDF